MLTQDLVQYCYPTKLTFALRGVKFARDSYTGERLVISRDFRFKGQPVEGVLLIMEGIRRPWLEYLIKIHTGNLDLSEEYDSSLGEERVNCETH